MTRSQYAAHRRTDPRHVRNALARGVITMEKDGKIDPVKADADWFANTAPANNQQAKTPRPLTPDDPVASTEAAAAARDLLRAASERVASGGRLSYADARCAHEVTKGQLAQLRLKEREGTLVDRAKAMDAIFALARQERDAWQSWPARISALMASRLGVDAHALEMELDKEVRSQLRSLAEVDVERAVSSARLPVPGVK